MVKRILANELNVKDENRLANAVSKLTTDSPAAPFTFSDDVIPVMVAGIEENQTDSTADLISCKRDIDGTNRLCIDSGGFPIPSNNQIVYEKTVFGAPPTSNSWTPINDFNYKILIVKSIIYSNQDNTNHNVRGFLNRVTTSGMAFGFCSLLPFTTFQINNLNIVLKQNDELIFTGDDNNNKVYVEINCFYE